MSRMAPIIRFSLPLRAYNILTRPGSGRYSTPMRTLFLADAHLRQEADDNYRLLMRFLAGLRGETETLYILGDLFDFWIGYPRSAFPHYLPLLEALEELRRSGTRIVYLEGNHGLFTWAGLHAGDRGGGP